MCCGASGCATIEIILPIASVALGLTVFAIIAIAAACNSPHLQGTGFNPTKNVHARRLSRCLPASAVCPISSHDAQLTLRKRSLWSDYLAIAKCGGEQWQWRGRRHAWSCCASGHLDATACRQCGAAGLGHSAGVGHGEAIQEWQPARERHHAGGRQPACERHRAGGWQLPRRRCGSCS